MRSATLSQQLWAITQLTRLDKPWGTVLLLWPTMWALWLATEGIPPYHMLGIFLCGGVFMRACGCVLNDVCDQDIDVNVDRTKDRPLASGNLSTKTALLVAIGLAGLAAGLLWFLNRTTQWLAVIGIILTVIYPTTKRWLTCPQLFLGMTFAWGIPMAFAASGHALGYTCWLLYAATACWIVGYDTIYAMQDLEDDRKLAIYTLPKYLNGNILWLTSGLYGVFWLVLGAIGTISAFNHYFYVCWLFAGYLLLAQLMVLKSGHGQYLAAFKSNQWVGFWLWVGVVLGAY